MDFFIFDTRHLSNFCPASSYMKLYIIFEIHLYTFHFLSSIYLSFKFIFTLSTYSFHHFRIRFPEQEEKTPEVCEVNLLSADARYQQYEQPQFLVLVLVILPLKSRFTWMWTIWSTWPAVMDKNIGWTRSFCHKRRTKEVGQRIEQRFELLWSRI